MTWLNESWIWIVVALGAFLLMTRMHGMGMGCGTAAMGHRRGRDASADGGRGTGQVGMDRDMNPGAMQHGAIDPVSRHPIAAGTNPVSSVYGGLIYSFETRENRDAFEREPEKYLADGGGQAAGNPSAAPRRHHGCC